MIRRLIRDSISARAVATIVFVIGGYVLLHARFAAFDAALASDALNLLGFDASSPRPGDLTVQAGTSFNVYAVVTGSCSSATGVLGLLAVSLILLPGRIWRRWAGGIAAAMLFMAFNVARICSIILLGWSLSAASRWAVLATLSCLAVGSVVVGLVPHGRLFVRIGALLLAGLCAVLIYDVVEGYNYLDGMASYHALAGPMLTFGSLAIGIIIIWRAMVGRLQPAAPV
jgi:hypothetical protein